MDKNKLAEDFITSYSEQNDCSENSLPDVAKSAFLAGFDAAEDIANAKIQELEKELKLEKMRGDHNSYCPNHQETKGLIVTEEFKANGVVVGCQFYKCPECDMTWLSGRQEHDVDMKIKCALESKITDLEQQIAEIDAEIVRLNQCQKDAFNVIKSRNDEVAALEQQLKKVDKILKSITNESEGLIKCHELAIRLDHGNSNYSVMCYWWNEARQYLKSRGE